MTNPAVEMDEPPELFAARLFVRGVHFLETFEALTEEGDPVHLSQATSYFRILWSYS